MMQVHQRDGSGDAVRINNTHEMSYLTVPLHQMPRGQALPRVRAVTEPRWSREVL